MFLFGLIGAHLGHIAQQGDASVGAPYHGVRDVLRTGIAATGLHVQCFRSHLNTSPGNVGHLALDGADHSVHRDVQLRQFLQAQVHAHNVLGQTADLHFLQHGQILQHILQAFGLSLQHFC